MKKPNLEKFVDNNNMRFYAPMPFRGGIMATNGSVMVVIESAAEYIATTELPINWLESVDSVGRTVDFMGRTLAFSEYARLPSTFDKTPYYEDSLEYGKVAGYHTLINGALFDVALLNKIKSHLPAPVRFATSGETTAARFTFPGGYGYVMPCRKCAGLRPD